MNIVTFEQLLNVVKPDTVISDDAIKLANALIAEYEIYDSMETELAETLQIEHGVSNRKAVRLWATKNLKKLDKDETFDERYRQLRRLFQQQLADLLYLV